MAKKGVVTSYVTTPFLAMNGQLEGQPQLMTFLAMLFTKEVNDCCLELGSDQWSLNDLTGYPFSQELMA